MGCDGVWELKSVEEIVKLCIEYMHVYHDDLEKVVTFVLDQLIAPDINGKLVVAHKFRWKRVR